MSTKFTPMQKLIYLAQRNLLPHHILCKNTSVGYFQVGNTTFECSGCQTQYGHEYINLSYARHGDNEPCPCGCTYKVNS